MNIKINRKYLNVIKKGNPIAIINGGKHNKTKIYLNGNNDDVDDDLQSYFENYQSPSKEVKLEYFPPCDKYFRGYIFGKSGSGKSYFISQIAQKYNKENPNSPIFFYSEKPEDSNFENVNMHRIPINDDLLDMDVDIKDIQNMGENSRMLVIFDDIDSLAGNLRKKVYSILTKYLNIGRQYKISVIISNHTPSLSAKDRDASKAILNECHWITFFPATFTRATNYLLQNYCGLDDKTIEDLKDNPSRWIMIFNDRPQMIMTQYELYPVIFHKKK
jgi:hypothetical protein